MGSVRPRSDGSPTLKGGTSPRIRSGCALRPRMDVVIRPWALRTRPPQGAGALRSRRRARPGQAGKRLRASWTGGRGTALGGRPGKARKRAVLTSPQVWLNRSEQFRKQSEQTWNNPTQTVLERQPSPDPCRDGAGECESRLVGAPAPGGPSRGTMQAGFDPFRPSVAPSRGPRARRAQQKRGLRSASSTCRAPGDHPPSARAVTSNRLEPDRSGPKPDAGPHSRLRRSGSGASGHGAAGLAAPPCQV